MADLFPVTLAEQVACVQREIAMRERVYPRFIEKGRMNAEKAGREIAAMKAVLETLLEVSRALSRAVDETVIQVRAGKEPWSAG